jgi:hypothetical protein
LKRRPSGTRASRGTAQKSTGSNAVSSCPSRHAIYLGRNLSGATRDVSNGFNLWEDAWAPRQLRWNGICIRDNTARQIVEIVRDAAIGQDANTVQLRTRERLCLSALEVRDVRARSGVCGNSARTDLCGGGQQWPALQWPMNPRDANVAGVVRLYRMIRRGTSSGLPLPDGALEDDGLERGLIFAVVGANLGRQFEFVQSEWMNDGSFFEGGATKDPVAGANGGGDVYSFRGLHLLCASKDCPGLASHGEERIAFCPAPPRLGMAQGT